LAAVVRVAPLARKEQPMAVSKAEYLRKAALELQKAQTGLKTAETMRGYVEMGVLSPLDVRKWLVKNNYSFLQAEK
jgi:hypothetical protein